MELISPHNALEVSSSNAMKSISPVQHSLVSSEKPITFIGIIAHCPEKCLKKQLVA